MLIEGLAGTESGKRLAMDLSTRWLRTNFAAWKTSGFMHEKYNAGTGEAGSGGEYEPQTGFGWSNGGVLTLLDRWPEIGWEVAETALPQPPPRERYGLSSQQGNALRMMEYVEVPMGDHDDMHEELIRR